MGTKTQTTQFYAVSKGYGYYPTGTSGPFSRIRQKNVVRTRTGTAVPNWWHLIQRGEDATSNMTARWDVVDAEVGAGNVVIYYGQPGQPNAHLATETFYYQDPLAGVVDLVPKAPALSSTKAANGASAKFYKKLREEVRQFSTPTFLGELAETMRMIKRPAGALYGQSKGYLDALSKAKRASPKHWTKAVSGLWLEHSFGWLPLLRDAEEAQKAYERLLTNGGTQKKIISAGYIDESDRSSSLSAVERGILANRWFGGFARYYQQGVLKETVVARYKAKMEKRVDATRWDNWALFGFEPKELIPTAWNLLPWSFLVDYFVNVGDCLDSVVTDTRRVSYATHTTVSNTLYKGSYVFDPVGSREISLYCTKAVHITNDMPTFEIKRKDVARYKVVSVPLPRLMWSPGLSARRLLNIGALLGSARSLHPQSNFGKYPRRR